MTMAVLYVAVLEPSTVLLSILAIAWPEVLVHLDLRFGRKKLSTFLIHPARPVLLVSGE